MVDMDNIIAGLDIGQGINCVLFGFARLSCLFHRFEFGNDCRFAALIQKASVQMAVDDKDIAVLAFFAV